MRGPAAFRRDVLFVIASNIFLLCANGAMAQGTLSGTITDSTGTPIPYAYVECQEPDLGHWYYNSADASGYYEVNGMSAGEYEVRASDNLHMGQYYGGVTYREEVSARVTVSDGSTTSGIDIALPDGLTISGTVTDVTGNPFSGAYLEAHIPGNPNVWWYLYASSDAVGEYRLRGLPPREVAVCVYTNDYIDVYYDNHLHFNDADLIALSPGTPVTGIDFTLRLGGVLRTAVMDASGLPVHDPSQPTLPDNNIWDIVADSSGDLWLATDRGVMGIVSGATVAFQPYNSNLPSNFVRAIAADSAGNRYYATAGGIAEHAGDAITVFHTGNSTLPSDDCTAILVHPTNGKIYIGTQDSWFVEWNGTTTFTSYSYAGRGESTATPISCLDYKSTTGEVAIGSDEGMTLFNPSTYGFDNYTTSNGLPTNQVRAVAQAGDGTGWIGTTGGLHRINPDSTTQNYTVADNLADNGINDIFVTPADDLWIGTNGGVSFFNGTSFTSYTTSNSDLYSNQVLSICLWQGDLYIGLTQGLDVRRGTAFHHISRQYSYASVVAHDPLQNLSYYAYMNYDIAADIKGMASGNYILYADASYYPRQYYDNVFFERQATPVSVTEGQTAPGRYVFQLEHFGSISGTASDSGGPLSSGSVRAYSLTDLNALYTAYVSGGTYSIGSVPPGEYFVCLSSGSYPTMFYPGVYRLSEASPVVVVSKQETSGIDFTLASADNGTISGAISDAVGNPYQFVGVNVQGVLSTNYSNQVYSDKDGDYSIGVPPGIYRVYMSPPGLPPVYYTGTFDSEAYARVEVNGGESVAGVNIEAPSFSPGGIRGIVVDDLGAPVEGATVQCQGQITYPETASDAAGAFEFSNLVPYSNYRLTASKTGYTLAILEPVDVPAGAVVESVTLELEPYATTAVRGTVSDTRGRRIWNAQIYLSSYDYPNSQYLYTDWLGRYRMASFPQGAAEIQADKSGYISSSTPMVVLGPGANVLDFVLEFDTSSYGVIDGRVLDQGGMPQPGLQVQLSGTSTYNVRTNRNGFYTSPYMQPGTYTVEVWSFPSDSTSVDGVSLAAGQIRSNINLTVNLPLGTISGRVTDLSAQSIAYPEVDAYPQGHNYYPAGYYEDEYGDYMLCGLRPGEYLVRASQEGYAARYYDGTPIADEATPVTVTGSENTPGIDILLPPGEVIRGTVTDAYDHPLQSAYVYVASLGPSSANGQDYSDYFGRYEVNTLDPGPYLVYAGKSNYYWEYYDEKPTSALADPVEVATGVPRTGIDISLGIGGGISGQVIDDSSAPYTSGTLYFSVSEDASYNIASTSLNATGEYQVEHLRPGQYYVRANLSGKPSVYYSGVFSVSLAVPVEVTDEAITPGINFVIPATIESATITGTMYNESGLPYPNVQVQIEGVDGTSGTYYTNASSTDGTYVRSGMTPGTYVVALRESNLPPYYFGDTYDQAGATRIHLNPGQTAEGIDITAPAKDYARVSGTVVDGSLQPVNGAYVTLSGYYSSYGMSTGPDGVFSFPQVFPQSGYTIYAEEPGYFTTQQSLEVPPGGSVTGVMLVLTSYEGGAIAGTVTDASGHLLEGAYLSFYCSSPTYSEGLSTDRYGTYHQANLPPGEYSVYCSLSGYQSETESPVTVTGGETTIQDFALQPDVSYGVVSGSIVDASGRPAYRIRVYTEGPSSRSSYTLADGTYKIPQLSAGTYRIYLPNESAPGNEQTGVGVSAGQETTGVDFTLNVAYGTISGTVTETGSGVPLQEMILQAQGFTGGFYSDSTTTDRQGNYLLGRLSLEAEEGFRLWCYGQGYIQTYWPGRVVQQEAEPVMLGSAASATDRDFSMRKGAVVRGQITNSTGEPLSSGTVYAYFQGPYGSISYNDSLNLTGWYEIPALPGGDYKLRMTATGYVSEYYHDRYTQDTADIVTVATGTVSTYHESLLEGASFRGRVVDAEGGAPITQGYVYAYLADGSDSFSDSLDSNGEYEITSLRPDHYKLEARATGYLREYYDNVWTLEEAEVIPLAVGQTRTMDFEVVRGGSITGHVADGEGSPITSGTIYAYRQPDNTSFYSGLDSEGNYAVAGLFGGDYKVRAYSSSYIQEYWDDRPDRDSGDIVAVATGETTANIDFILTPGGSLAGTVLDASGDPYTSGTVYLSRPSAPSTSVYSTGLNTSGEYSFSQVRGGNYYAYLYLSGQPRVFYPYAFSIAEASQVTIVDGITLTGVDFTIPRNLPTVRVSGSVTQDGAGVYCIARIKGVDGYTDTSGYWTHSESGAFDISGYPAGTYVFYADRTNYPYYYYGGTEDESLATRVVLRPGDEVSGVDIELPTTEPDYGSLSGLVRDELGQPIAEASVNLSGVESYSMLSANDGSFYFSRVLPGAGYTLSGSKPGYYAAERTEITVPEGERVWGQHLTLTGYTGGTLAGRVYNASGGILSEVYVYGSHTDVSYDFYGYSDQYGEYYQDNLPPGNYTLYFDLSGYRYLYAYEVPVVAAQTTIHDATLSFLSGQGVVTGTVTDASGNPAYRIYVRTGNGTYRTTYTDLEGRYFLSGLNAGTDYRIYCPNEPGIPEATAVVVVADQFTERVDLALSVPYATLQGTITNSAALPVYRAEVYGQAVSTSPNPDMAYSSYRGTYILPRVRTDGGRIYRVYAQGAPYSRTYYERTQLSGSATIVEVTAGQASQSGIDIALIDGAEIRGRVRNESDVPLVGCALYVRQRDGNYNSATFYTDEGGRYHTQGLSPGIYKVRAKLDGYVAEYYDDQPTLADGDEIVLATGALRTGISFVLGTGRSIMGWVVDSARVPIPSAVVYVDNAQATDCSGEGKANGEGYYEVTGLAADVYRVRAQRSGYTTRYVYDVDTSGSMETRVNFVLYRVGEDEKPGDFNSDGYVDPTDLFGLIDEIRNGGNNTDMTSDGLVDYRDLFIFSGCWEP